MDCTKIYKSMYIIEKEIFFLCAGRLDEEKKKTVLEENHFRMMKIFHYENIFASSYVWDILCVMMGKKYVSVIVTVVEAVDSSIHFL